MKITTIGILIIAACLNFGCKKTEKKDDSNYDVTNKIFRVNVEPGASPFNVSITQFRPGYSNNPYSVIEAKRNFEFNYGFTPAIGDSIVVVIQSDSNIQSSYSGYLGVTFDPTTNQTTPTGGLYEQFNYVIKN